MCVVMPERAMEAEPRLTKAHSKLVADELQRLGWTLRKEFRAAGDEEPYEYLFAWLHEDSPVYPKTASQHEKA